MAAAREGYKSGYDMPDSLPCDEIGQFKESLAQMRAIDDRIIYKLNTSIPTQSFSGQVSAATQCKQLYDELRHVYAKRQGALSRCIDVSTTKVKRLKEQDEGASSSEARKTLKKELTTLRLMQSEQTVEAVVRERSLKVFKERCWQAYQPPDL